MVMISAKASEFRLRCPCTTGAEGIGWHEHCKGPQTLRQHPSERLYPATIPPFAYLRECAAASGDSTDHMRALSHSEVAAAIEAVRTSAATLATRLAFEFMVLTACRSGEVRLAGWDEIDLEASEWTIPGERMKAQRPHRVPLSGRAMEILGEARTLGGGGGLVFPSAEGRPLSGSTLSTLLRGLRIAAVPH